jgi:hypothetical protein
MFSFIHASKSPISVYENNKYKNFPPIMNDSRSLVSTWKSESEINNKLIKENNIQSNWKYRQFLTKNASSIMENNFSESLKNSGYDMTTVEKTTYQTPLKFDSLNDRSQTFQNSDLKEIYLTREQLNAKKVAILISR